MRVSWLADTFQRAIYYLQKCRYISQGNVGRKISEAPPVTRGHPGRGGWKGNSKPGSFLDAFSKRGISKF